MARQRFFPRTASGQALWFGRYAFKLTELGPGLGLPPAEVAASVADALYLEYCLGIHRVAVRNFAKGVTAALRDITRGEGTAPLPMPEMADVPLPSTQGALPAVVPVLPGALKRVMKFVQRIQTLPGYNDVIGDELGIIGASAAAPRAVPDYSVDSFTAVNGQQVRVRFKKHNRLGVVIESRRGNGDWESLGLSITSPHIDARPLLVAGQPEQREYRLRYFDGSAATGDYTPVTTVVVGV